MLRKDVETQIASINDENIRIAALAELKAIPERKDSPPNQGFLTSREVRTIIGVILGKPLEKPITYKEETEISPEDRLEWAFKNIIKIMNELISFKIFNEKTRLIIWNCLHANKDSEVIEPNHIIRPSELSQFLTEAEKIVDSLGSLYDAIIMFTQYGNPDYWQHSFSWLAIESLNEIKKYLEERQISRNKKIELPHNILFMILYFSSCGYKIQDWFIHEFFITNKELFKNPYIAILLCHHYDKHRELSNFIHYLSTLQKYGVLNKITADVKLDNYVFSFPNREIIDSLAMIFNLIGRNHILSFQHVDLESKPHLQPNPLLLGVAIHRRFDFVDSAHLAQTNKQLKQLFDPHIQFQQIVKLKIIARCHPGLLPTVARILKAWHRKKLCTAHNLNLLLDYMPMLGWGARFREENKTFIAACINASTQKKLNDIFKRFAVENQTYKITININLLSTIDHTVNDIPNKEKIKLTIDQEWLAKHSREQKESIPLQIRYLKSELNRLKESRNLTEGEYHQILVNLLVYFIEDSYLLNKLDYIKIIVATGADFRHDVIVWCKLAAKGDPAITHFLLQHTHDESKESKSKPNTKFDFVNIRNHKRATLLHIAVEHDNPAMVEYLLENKADPQACDASGNLPIHYLSQSVNADEILKLLSPTARANFQRKNLTGHTPLHVAIKNGRLSAIDAFIKLGAPLYSAYSKSIADFLLQMELDSFRTRDSFYFMIFCHLDKFLDADKERLLKRIDSHAFAGNIHWLDFISCLQALTFLTHNYLPQLTNLQEQLYSQIEEYLPYLDEYEFIRSGSSQSRSGIVDFHRNLDRSCKALTSLPLFLLEDKKSQAQLEVKDEPGFNLVKIWKEIKTMMLKEPSSELLRHIIASLLHLINAVETNNFLDATRIALTILVHTGNDSRTRKTIHLHFAKLLKLKDHQETDSSKPLSAWEDTARQKYITQWARQHCSKNHNQFYAEILLFEHQKFYQFLQANPKELKLFYHLFSKLELQAVSPKDNPKSIAKLLFDYQENIRKSATTGRQLYSLMPIEKPDQTTGGIELMDVKDFQVNKKQA